MRTGVISVKQKIDKVKMAHINLSIQSKAINLAAFPLSGYKESIEGSLIKLHRCLKDVFRYKPLFRYFVRCLA